MKMLSARNYKVISKSGTSTGYVIVKSLASGPAEASQNLYQLSMRAVSQLVFFRTSKLQHCLLVHSYVAL